MRDIIGEKPRDIVIVESMGNGIARNRNREQPWLYDNRKRSGSILLSALEAVGSIPAAGKYL